MRKHPWYAAIVAANSTILKTLLPHIACRIRCYPLQRQRISQCLLTPHTGPRKSPIRFTRSIIHLSRKHAAPLYTTANSIQVCVVLAIKMLTGHLRCEFMKIVHTNTITYKNNKQSFDYVYMQIICTFS